MAEKMDQRAQYQLESVQEAEEYFFFAFSLVSPRESDQSAWKSNQLLATTPPGT